MATPNRWAIKEAGIASFFDLTTGKAKVTLATLKTSGVETTGETTYATGGRGNARLVGFSSNRQAKITLQDAIFDNAAIAMLTGNDLVAGVKKVDKNEIQSVTSNTLTLSKTPQGAIVSVYKLNADGTNGQEYTLGTPASNATDYSVAGKVLTFHTSVTNGTQFKVYYQVNTASDAKSVKVTSDQFGKTFRVTLDVLVVDEFTKAAFQGQLRIPNAKFEDNFNLSFSADGDPAVLDLNMEILKSPTSTDMWELVIYDDAAIV
jgi:hypothetical protein